jgi:hypothetical protein
LSGQLKVSITLCYVVTASSPNNINSAEGRMNFQIKVKIHHSLSLAKLIFTLLLLFYNQEVNQDVLIQKDSKGFINSTPTPSAT